MPDGAEIASGWFVRSAMDERGNPVEMYTHGGRLLGSTSRIGRRDDGFSFVLFTNTDLGVSATVADDMSNLANSITRWPEHDLFPSMGLPACPPPVRKPTPTVPTAKPAEFGPAGRRGYRTVGG